jgi:hypothetical protein
LLRKDCTTAENGWRAPIGRSHLGR